MCTFFNHDIHFTVMCNVITSPESVMSHFPWELTSGAVFFSPPGPSTGPQTVLGG